MFRDTGDWTLMPEPQSSVDRGSGSAHSLNTVSSGSSPRVLLLNPRNCPHVTAMYLDCPKSLYVSQAD